MLSRTQDVNAANGAKLPAEASRVLIVEDDIVSQEYLMGQLTRWGFVPVDAESVSAAEAVLTARGLDNFDCVITDYRMPEKSGLDLLAWIQERDSRLSTIFLTGDRQASLVAASMRGGAVELLDKPVNPPLLRAALDKAVARTRQQRAANGTVARPELGQAQRWMLDSSSLGDRASVDLYSHVRLPSGGDFFSRFELAPDRYFFLLTDVSGHDVQAAYISAYFQGIVRGMLERGASMGAIFQFFNRFLLEEWKTEKPFCPAAPGPDISLSACALSLDFQERTATTLTSGAPAAVYLTNGGYARRLGQQGSSPLGWFPDTSISAMTYGIADGGAVLMWTDGLEDLAHARGVDPLALAFCWQRARHAGAAFSVLESSVDDVLMARITLRGTAAGPGFHPLILEEYDVAEMSRLDEWMERWRRSVRLAAPNISSASEHDLTLASREAVLNALEHGCRDCPQYPVQFQIGYRPEDGLLRAWVQDPGPGHEEFLETPEDDTIPEHFGLQLIKRLPKAVKFAQSGASVTMDFALT